MEKQGGKGEISCIAMTEDIEVKQAFDNFSEKVNEFLKRAPFYFVKTRQFYAGDQHLKPECALCGSKRANWFTVVTNREGKLCYVGSSCFLHIRDKIIYRYVWQ